MKSLYLAASLALVALPANAAAQPAQSDAAAKPAKTAQPAQQTKYCLTYEPITGSRVAKSECKTKADWALQGIDVDELLKK